MSIDVLIDKIRQTKNPTVAGLDPRPEYLPPDLLKKHIEQEGETLEAVAAAFLEFNRGLIDALCDVVPAVKLQAACYEMLGPAGMTAMRQSILDARARGLYVIADVKRNDIGSTAEAYAAAWLGSVKVGNTELEPFAADSATINAYLGSDGVKPFLDVCAQKEKSVFALIKTSNPSAGELQELMAGDRQVFAVVGELVERWGRGLIGRYGYSQLGGVVGATYPRQLKTLREALPQTFFLVPGYGAQGGQAADVVGAFDRRGLGAIINSSRGILCAWQKTGQEGRDYAQAARDEAVRMRAALKQVVTVV